MNVRRLRYLRSRGREFNVSRAGNFLHTLQPVISKQIRALANELGVDMLMREGNRVVGLTAPGKAADETARRMSYDAGILRSRDDEFTRDKKILFAKLLA